MKQLLKITIIALTICYPFMVYWGLQNFDSRLLLILLLLLLGLRWLVAGKISETKALVATLFGVIVMVLLWGHQLGLKFYPVLMSLSFLFLFTSSLLSPPSIIEKIARIREPDLPPQAVIYTRKVTVLWCVFFLINGTIAAVTAIWGSDEAWMLYNGLIAYLLMGILLSGEWLVRQRLKRG